MRDSIRLGRISDIPIGLHWSIVVIVGLFTLGLSGTILPAAAPGYATVLYLAVAFTVAVALLASIIAHELGHSLVAQRNDIPVRGITLFALGGVAKLDGDPRTPGVAARIALAGPAVSVAIGVGAMVVSAVAGALGVPALIGAGLFWLGVVNLVMAVFNMLPALPLDGGRVLQAALWSRSGDRERATISAAQVGRWLGWTIVALGLWQFLNTGSGLWTMIIGWFIVSSAKAESLRARFRLHSRNWAPPQWSAWQGPGRSWPGPGQAPPFGPPSGPAGPADVIDVEGHKVG